MLKDHLLVLVARLSRSTVCGSGDFLAYQAPLVRLISEMFPTQLRQLMHVQFYKILS
jgi:hypothetical protein